MFESRNLYVIKATSSQYFTQKSQYEEMTLLLFSIIFYRTNSSIKNIKKAKKMSKKYKSMLKYLIEVSVCFITRRRLLF